MKVRATPVAAKRRNRVTGTTLALYDCRHPESEFDGTGARWATLCVTHSRICNHSTRLLATLHLAAPWGWCEKCAEVASLPTDNLP